MVSRDSAQKPARGAPSGYSTLFARLDGVKSHLFHVLEEGGEDASMWASPLKVAVFLSTVLMILVSLVSFVLETMASLADVPRDVWATIEAITTILFTIEYSVRLWVCDAMGTSKIEWALRPLNFCDLLALLPFYAEFVTTADISWLRVLRVVRLIKLGRFSCGVQVMMLALLNSLPALNILICLFMLGMITFASAVYFTEKFSCPDFGRDREWGLAEFRVYNEECDPAAGNSSSSSSFGACCVYQCRSMPLPSWPLCQYSWMELPLVFSTARQSNETSEAHDLQWEVRPMHQADFSSILTAMWWACVTMSTVGYGDIVPQNWVSKCVASVAMVTGLLMIALPFTIIGTKFGEAVAVCEAGDARSATASRLKKVREFGGLTCTSSQTPLGIAALPFEDLKKSLRESLELKQEILRVQQLRDNLWTSAEHAMASLALEGINILRDDLFDSQPYSRNEDDHLCEWSCFIFHRNSMVRRLAIRFTHSHIFECVVVFAIVTNSVILANLDYYPRQEEPWQNVLQQRTELPFIILFTLECVVKIVARGFVLDPHSYLRDGWNWIDFAVVVTGVTLIDTEDLTIPIIRVVRVLRPLRTLSVMPGMRKLVNTILRSLPGLKDVVLMALFLLTIFGILGLHFYGGVMHRRCRVTPQPLHFTQRALESQCRGWCFDNRSLVHIELSNQATIEVDSAIVFEAFCREVPACAEAFAKGGDYFVWPIDTSQDRFCGEYECKLLDVSSVEGWRVGRTNSSELLQRVLEPFGAIVEHEGSPMLRTVCGSPLDDDHLYAPGAANPELRGVSLDAPEAEVNSSSFNWGLTHYDQIGGASLVVFQCVTLEGWVDIMYMLQDAYSSWLGFTYFLLLILIGYFFLLNIILAIVYDAFICAEVSQPREASEVPVLPEPQPSAAEDTKMWHQSRGRWQVFVDDCCSGCVMLIKRKSAGDVDKLLLEPHRWRVRTFARWLASSSTFDCCMLLSISLNVVVLALDRYPMPVLLDRVAYEFLNRTFNVIFMVEFVTLHAALGPFVYWCDNALAFDGVIVMLSVLDEALILAGAGATGGSLQAVRAFRLLRIFKLAKRFPSMKVLLKACVQTVLCMREFVLLLFIVVCVFALMGQSVFGGKFLFDHDGSVISRDDFAERCPFGNGGQGKPECVPRAHFDTFLWSVVTIFQILTGENWNSVMYDGMRATQWHALFFFVGVMIMGQFVILNLCLSILMMNFEYHRTRMAAIEKTKEKKVPKGFHAAKLFVSRIGPPRLSTISDLNSEEVRSSFAARKGCSCPTLQESTELNGYTARKLCSCPTTLHESAESPAPILAQQGPESSAELRVENVSDSSSAEAIQLPWQTSQSLRVHAGTAPTTPAGAALEANVVPGCVPEAEAEPEPSPPEDSPEPWSGDPGSERDNTDEVFTEKGVHAEPHPYGSDLPSIERLIPSRLSSAPHFNSLKRRSFFIFDDAHPLRLFCLHLAKHPRFDQVIIVLITISSLLMMLQNPLHDPAGTSEVVLDWANTAFTTVFTLEMLVKMTALGVFCGQPGRPAYLQSSWNILDAFIVTVSLADVIQKNVTHSETVGVFGLIQVFRGARVLRPLRLISRNENLKVVVKTIAASLPELCNLTAFSLLFFLIFALLGVSNLKGSFYRCLDQTLADYSFSQLQGVTPLCIPPEANGTAVMVAGAALDSVMRFATHQKGPACDAGWDSWQRPSADTPICEVHCSSAATHPFCQRSDRPWGYHVMRCTDCRAEFCPEADPDREGYCRSFCDGHMYFCVEAGDREACLSHCVAECLCEDHCVGLSLDAGLCVEQGGRWINMNQNFDDIVSGMISLFEICTTEGWVDVMVASTDFQGPYLQPKRDAHELVGCTLSVLFILIGSFFVLNLCVGVIIDNYHKQREQRGRLMVTEAQKSWITYQKALYTKRRFFLQTNLHELPPTRQHLMRVVSSATFENSIMASIILNTVTLGLVIYPEPSSTYGHVLARLNVVFAIVFNIEALMKCYAMRCSYFKESWNVFDFACVVVSDVFLIAEEVVQTDDSARLAHVIKGVRIFRIARLFRLVRFLKGLNQLTMAFILSVPKLFNVGFIMLLLIYLFAVLGVNLFADVKYIEGGSYDDHANFRTFMKAMSLLIRSVTGEGWNAIMHDLSKDKFFYESYLGVQCHDYMANTVTAANFHSLDLDGDGVVDDQFINGCGKKGMAFTYFITYTLIVTFVIINLFIAVIFEGFEESSRSKVTDLLQRCVEAWRRYDPDSTMHIPLDRALDFIDEAVSQLCHHQGDPDLMMESRWDPHYTGMTTDSPPLALYNLRYMRIVGLRVTPSNKVRFVVAVKAVVRRIICMGGLNCRGITSVERMQNLRELETLDRLLESPDQGDSPVVSKELLKLRRMERKQARAIKESLASSSQVPSVMEGSGRLLRKLSRHESFCSSCSNLADGGDDEQREYLHDEHREYLLLREVAAAKIQRRFKEGLQRRRARVRTLTKGLRARRATKSPVPRAAG